MIIESANIPADIGSTVLRALCAISDNGPTQMNRLAESLGTTTSNITGIIDSAYLSGWLDRKPHPNDRRKQLVVITEKGTTLINSLKP